jgi:large subunit ribosomal protein L9
VPQGMAITATKKNVAAVDAERKRILMLQEREAARVQQEADKLKGVTVTIMAKAGEGGKLYGSVTNMDIAKALADGGLEVDRRRVLLEQPIKRTGSYPIKVKLHPQVVVEVTVVVEAVATEAQAEGAPAENAAEE